MKVNFSKAIKDSWVKGFNPSVSWWNGFTYFFKRKWRQIKNVIHWIPKIWNQFDFDYRYSLEVFQHQLEKQAKHFESDRSVTLSAPRKAEEIRMVLRLMKKVYDEDYACEYQDQIKEKYGNWDYEFVEIPNNDFINPMSEKGKKGIAEPTYEMKRVWECSYSEEKLKEIKEEERELFLKSHQKQERAHSLLWKLIEYYIRGWWD